ncbi:MAG: hypothetical protein RMY28_003170 [Nostoc sp. ChiSLP01]|nr:hypothetical protein [Nostoc sp. CmiSLP01]MDZ8283205.1 hypothetical protein [Nostoc sp. ChiSLP01]
MLKPLLWSIQLQIALISFQGAQLDVRFSLFRQKYQYQLLRFEIT